MKHILQAPFSWRAELNYDTVKLLRIPFSFFLSPVYLFALSQVQAIDWMKAILVFIILHFLIYPASNGYNSFMDRDTESIGGLENPPPPSRQLYVTTIVLDAAGILLSVIVGWVFTLFVLSYIAFSKAYSYRRIRIKRYSYLAYFVVILFQGAITFWSVYYGSNASADISVPWQGMVVAALLVGGFYPLTQIYQHRQDLEDGVQTISYKLGYKGTFLFCGFIYLLAWSFLLPMFFSNGKWDQLLMIFVFFIPVIIYYLKWFAMVSKDVLQANYRNTMNMTWLAATCTNSSFFILMIWNNY